MPATVPERAENCGHPRAPRTTSDLGARRLTPARNDLLRSCSPRSSVPSNSGRNLVDHIEQLTAETGQIRCFLVGDRIECIRMCCGITDDPDLTRPINQTRVKRALLAHLLKL